LKYALDNGDAEYLLKAAIDELRKTKIILPAITTIERAVWEARQGAEEEISKLLTASLTPEQIEKLGQLLSPMPESSKTRLAWLREIPGNSTPGAFLAVSEKLVYLRGLELQIDTKDIHPNRLRQLSKIGARYEPYAFRRFDDLKKHAILAAYLVELAQDLTDQAFVIHDRQIAQLQKKGRNAQDELQKKNGKSINEKVAHFADLGAALIKARNEGTDPFAALEAVMPWDKLVASVEEAKQLARPIDYDFLDLLETKFYVLRKYTPTMLKVLEFRSTKSLEPLMKAIDVVRDMNETGKRKVPEDAPLDFVSKRWEKHLYDEDGTINRHYYEILPTRLALLRKEAGISQEELGKTVGLKQFTISDIERGKSLTSVETLAALAEYFNTTTDYLLGRSDVRERQ